MAGGGHRRRGGAWLATAAAAAVLAGPLGAQSAPPPGETVRPPTRSEIDRLPTAPPPSRRSGLTVDDGIERAPCPLQAPRFAAVTVKLDQVVYDQLEAVDPAELAAAAAPYLGRGVPIAAVCEIRDAAATILRGKGYLAAVQVPPQRIDGGTVHLTVLMAHLVAVHVRGDAGHAEARIAAYLERLERSGPFNQKQAERALLLSGDLPGFDIHLTLRPAGTTPGAVVGDVSVSRIPFAMDANVQNLGSRSVGRWSGLVNFEANDLLGLGDRAVIGFYNTAAIHEQNVVQGSYEIRPGAQGLTIAGRLTHAWTRPDVGGGDPIRAKTLIATAEASYPLIRRQTETLRVAGGIDVVDQRLNFAGLPFTDDRLRVLYARADFSAVDPASIASVAGFTPADPRWRVAGTVELRQGLAALGASRRCGPAPFHAGCAAVPSISRLDADPQATLFRASATVALRPARQVTLVVSPRAQIAFSPLLSFEQFAIGNYTIGRGYDPGSLSGDSGYGAQFEARLGPLPVPYLRDGAIQPFGFVDAARSFTQGPIPSVYDRESVVSIGGGARLSFRQAALELLLAAPLGRAPLAGHDNGVRVLINVSAHLDARKR